MVHNSLGGTFVSRFQYRVFALAVIWLCSCSSNEYRLFEKPTFQFFKLKGLNQLVQQIAFFGSQTTYIHRALTKEGRLSSSKGCQCGSLEDAARATLVYLRHAEITGDSSSEANGVKLLITIANMQKSNGAFFDWFDEQGLPPVCENENAETFGYPEVRAIWALAVGARFFEKKRPSFADDLHQAFWRSFVHVDSCLARYGQFREQDGMRFPQWLPYRSGADAASELILTFDAILQCALNNPRQTRRLELAMRQFAEGIQRMQAGGAGEFPYGAHLADESHWHSRGNCAMQALALAGARFNQQDWIESAIVEADHFVPYLQENSFAHRFNLLEARDHPNRIDYFKQSAADIRPLVTGLLEISRVTGSRRYARRAGEVARWFRGENKAREAIYLEKIGLAKDFIQAHNYVAPALTAGSTIEALMAILEVENNSDSKREFYVKVENVFEGRP